VQIRTYLRDTPTQNLVRILPYEVAMKLVTYSDFLNLPDGTLYAEYKPTGNIGNLSIKRDTIIGVTGKPCDFRYSDLITIDYDDTEDFFTACERLEKGEETKLHFNTIQRHGIYEGLFLTFDTMEIFNMAGLLGRALLTQQQYEKTSTEAEKEPQQ